MSASKIVSPAILLRISKEILADDLMIPVIPEIALRVRKIADDNDSGISDLAQVVKTDPSLSAYVVSVANSALYARATKANDVLDALSRIGSDNAANLAMTYSLRSLFTTKNKRIDQCLRKLWRHSTYLASIASILASKTKSACPERALLAGLLQDIGSLPMVIKLEKYPEIIEDESLLYQSLEKYSSQIGVRILQHWGFDEEMIEAVRTREDWQRDTPGKMDLSDLILIARLHSFMGTARIKALPTLDQLPAFSKLKNNELTPDFSLVILSQAKEEIEALHLTFGQ
jgi:HD-like signal output (HDOD) protein